MRTLILVFLTIMFLLSQGAFPTSNLTVKAKTQDKSQTQQSSNAKPSSSALAEASRLSESVVKLYTEGKYEEALPQAKRALEISESALPPDDERLNAARSNLAELYIALKKYGDAGALLERTLKSNEKITAIGPRIAATMRRLALVEFAKGNSGKSEMLYKRALEITESAYGPDNEKIGASLFDLAEFYQFTGEYKKAEPLYQRLIAVREKTSQKSDADQLTEALDRYACLMRKTKRSTEAAQLEARAYGTTSGIHGMGMLAPIEGGVINGKAISLPKPPYPAEARAARVSGKVSVRVTIDETGNVIRVCAVEGPPLLVRESEIAANRARFSPTQLSGKPVKVTGLITYNFVAR